MKTKVAVYCACQNIKYLILSLFSALELYNLNPYLDKIIILTDLDIFKKDEFSKYNIEIINIKDELYLNASKKDKQNIYLNRKIKIYHFNHIKQYDQAMFVDSDILPVKDCMDVWDLVKNDEIGICANEFETVGEWGFYNKNTPESTYIKKNIAPETKMWTAGFLVYNVNEQTELFFKEWLNQWNKFKLFDAGPFLMANKNTKNKLVEIPSKYNFCPSKLRDEGIEKGDEAVHIHFKRWIYNFNQLPELYKKHALFSFPIVEKYYSLTELTKIFNQ